MEASRPLSRSPRLPSGLTRLVLTGVGRDANSIADSQSRTALARNRLAFTVIPAAGAKNLEPPPPPVSPLPPSPAASPVRVRCESMPEVAESTRGPRSPSPPPSPTRRKKIYIDSGPGSSSLLFLFLLLLLQPPSACRNSCALHDSPPLSTARKVYVSQFRAPLSAAPVSHFHNFQHFDEKPSIIVPEEEAVRFQLPPDDGNAP